MSVISKLADSVDNGLKIVEFIQENREELQKTYGRSAISKPKSKERIQAWETFIEKKSESNSGPERSGASRNDTGEGAEEPDKGNNREQPGKVSKPNSPISGTNGNRDFNSRDDSDPNPSKDIELRGNNESVRYTNRGGGSNMEGDDEHEGGTGHSERGDTAPVTSDEVEGASGGDEDKLFTTRVISIKETTPEDLEQMLEEIRPVPTKRLRNIAEISKNTEDFPTNLSPIKKTTQESSVSTHLVGKPLLKAGATQGVQESSSSPPFRSASVESAQTDVLSVSTTMTDDEQFEELNSPSGNALLMKMDEILTNQKKILEKLNVINEIKEDINGIKKILVNHGVALSTLDSYIGDLKIIIPKSGVETPELNGPINPDLRMVIGRDKTRGKAEVLKKKSKNDKIEISEDLFIIPELDEQYITKRLDNKSNNAANFVPTDDKISIEIIKGIIHNEVGDPEMINQFLELVDVGVHSMSVKEVYDNIRSLLDELHIHEHENYISRKN